MGREAVVTCNQVDSLLQERYDHSINVEIPDFHRFRSDDKISVPEEYKVRREENKWDRIN